MLTATGRRSARKVKGAIDPDARVRTTVGKVLTPEQIAASGTEHAHQAATFQWIAIHGRKRWPDLEMLFAVPNGGDRRPSVAAAMRAEGVKPGVPDMCLPVPRAGQHGLWVELKTPDRATKKDGGRSVQQIEWHRKLVDLGYRVVLAYGWQATCWALQLYLEDGLCGAALDADGVLWALPVGEPPVVAITE